MGFFLWLALVVGFLIFFIRIQHREIKKLRKELAQANHFVAMYRTGNIVEGMRREVVSAQQAYVGLARRHEIALEILQALGFRLEDLPKIQMEKEKKEGVPGE